MTDFHIRTPEMRFFLVASKETGEIIGGYTAHTEKDALKCASGLADHLGASDFEDWRITETSREDFAKTGLPWRGDPCGRSGRQPHHSEEGE